MTSKYGRIAVEAVKRCRSGDAAEAAWKAATAYVFPDQPASRLKGYPKCAFDGLVDAGRIVGVPRSSDLPRRTHNAEYAVIAADIPVATPGHDYTPPELWHEVMDGEVKRHNAPDVDHIPFRRGRQRILFSSSEGSAAGVAKKKSPSFRRVTGSSTSMAMSQQSENAWTGSSAVTPYF